MSKSAKKCIFCGKPSRLRAKEHVVPLWLEKYLGITKEQTSAQFNKYTGSRFARSPIVFGSNLSFESKITRIHQIGNFLSGFVCKKCNEGWMNDLENAARSMLKSLVSGTITASSLSDQERLILARWAAKTAYSLNFALTDTNYVPSSHPKILKDDDQSIPPRVAVFAGQVDPDRAFDWVISCDWAFSPSPMRNSQEGLKELVERARNESYKVSFQLSHLHLIVASWPNDDCAMTAPSNTHTLIFTNQVPIILSTGEDPVQIPPHSSPFGRHRFFHYALGLTELRC